MKLCYIADERSEHTRRWVSYFAERGHDVHFITWHGAPRYNVPGVHVHPMPSGWGRHCARFATKAWQVRTLLRRVRPDLLHAHFVEDCGRLAAFTGFRPLVLTAWGSDIYQHPFRSRWKFHSIGWALRRAALVTCDAVDLREAAVRLGAAPERTKIIFHGVDSIVFRPNVATEAIRRELELGEAPVVLSTRWFEPLYNVDTLLACAPQVLRRVPNAVLVLKGIGPEEASLRAQARELGIADNVRFVGYLPRHEDLAALYAAAEVFVSVASSDSTPVSLLEALASGCAPVVTDLPALREWVTDGVNGRVVPVRDVSALAEAIAELLTQPALRAAARVRNVELARTKGDYARNMAQMERLYEQLCAQDPGVQTR